ncbi:MAG: hypothetical protein IID33_13860 [Planctomycetes bacterium]|nr:hypothetical protein [Planctomycetota bacterium]
MVHDATSSLVLSGCGWVTPCAVGSIDEVLAAWAKDSAVSQVADGGFCRVPDDPPIADISHLSNELKRDKGAWMAALAIEHACRTASLPLQMLDSDRVGLALGCGLAGQLGMIEFASEVRKQSVRFVSPIHFPQTVGNYVAGAIARSYKLRGPNATFASGASSSLDAIIEACAWVARGDADVVLAGGVERLTNGLAMGFGSDGAALSEGACFVVVESADHASRRSASPLANVVRCAPGPDRHAETGILSTAGCALPGAVVIEHATGLCLGAAGAAATAAAIGAAHGAVVPRVDASDSRTVTFGVMDLAGLDVADGYIRATILAANKPSARDQFVRLELNIPVSS